MAIPEEEKYLKGVNRQTKLYKIIPLKHILSMLVNNIIRVSNVMKWEDIYENYFLKQQFTLEGKIVDVRTVANNYFGMCWTLNEETDAMWRIYSLCGSSFTDLDNVGIRVETTASQLLNALWGKIYDSPATVGIVEYRTRDSIDGHIAHLERPNINNEITNSLFTKRQEFEHENEARIIIGVGTDVLSDFREFFDVDFNPYELFNSFMIDPRATTDQEEEIKKLLFERGVNDGILSKSNLYTFTQQTIELT